MRPLHPGSDPGINIKQMNPCSKSLSAYDQCYEWQLIQALAIVNKDITRQYGYVIISRFRDYIQLLEESAGRRETRLRQDHQGALQQYEQRLKQLQEDYAAQQDQQQQRMKQMNAEHSIQLQQLQQNHRYSWMCWRGGHLHFIVYRLWQFRGRIQKSNFDFSKCAGVHLIQNMGLMTQMFVCLFVFFFLPEQACHGGRPTAAWAATAAGQVIHAARDGSSQQHTNTQQVSSSLYPFCARRIPLWVKIHAAPCGDQWACALHWFVSKQN